MLTSFEALQLKKVPASIIILGAGAIGVEFAYFLNAFGCKVTLVEMLPRILPVEDEEVSAGLERAFKKQGIECRTGVKADNIRVEAAGVKVDLGRRRGRGARDGRRRIAAHRRRRRRQYGRPAQPQG